MNRKTLTWIGAYLVVGYGLFYYFKKYHVSRKEKALISIAGKNFSGADTDYLEAWAKGIKSAAPSFEYKGGKYSSDTGKKIG